MEVLNDDLTEYDSTNAQPQLRIIYSWMWSTFAALDLGSKGVINLSDDGASISKGLCDGGLKHLWTIMVELCGSADTITPEKFVSIFLAWMGIDEAFEARVRAGV
jgi:hypothetical protein